MQTGASSGVNYSFPMVIPIGDERITTIQKLEICDKNLVRLFPSQLKKIIKYIQFKVHIELSVWLSEAGRTSLEIDYCKM